MRLFAFQGLRYTSRAGDVGRLAAPPYDQIDDAARDRYHAASPYQFVHLTRPTSPDTPGAPDTPGTPGAPDGGNGAGPAAAGSDPYRHAAELHRRWLRDGILARDEQPALYPYVVELAGGGRRLGVMGLVAYAPPSEIRPHEQTIDKPLAERLALLEATHVDLEPALLLAEDDGKLDRLLAEDLDGTAPGTPGTPSPPGTPGAVGAGPVLVDYADPEGNHHRLYRIADPARIAAYQRALAAGPAAIADGHHRYKVGQLFAKEHAAATVGRAGAHGADAAAGPGAAPTAAAAKLAVVTSIDSPALTIDPIHRALRQPVDLAHLKGALAPAAPVAAVPFHGSSGAELARAVAAAPQPALGVWSGAAAGGAPEIWHLAPASPAGTGAAAPADPPLVVEIFQDAVLPALGLAREAAADGTLVYRSDPDTLYRQVASGELGTGFWLPPMRPAEFAAAIAHGDLLPPKSTRFLPKAMSGLVWSDHASRVSG